MTSAADNFLLAEPLLIERLREHVPEAKFVGGATDMERIDERTQITPAVYVLFEGYTPGDSNGGGAVQRITQQWMVVGAVRNVTDQMEGTAAREDAGRLLAKILQALQGHRLHHDLSQLQLGPAAPPVYNAGLAYIPTVWTTAITTRGSQQ